MHNFARPFATAYALALVVNLVVNLGVARGQQDVGSQLELQSAEVRDGDRSLDAEFGHMTVPQFHDDPESKHIKLAVLVRRSTAAKPGPPIFFLNGIPDGATDLAAKE